MQIIVVKCWNGWTSEYYYWSKWFTDFSTENVIKRYIVQSLAAIIIIILYYVKRQHLHNRRTESKVQQQK